MNRLLQGDVGSGKTVVAGLAMFATVTAGYQAALMVPTEILAEQHFESLQSLFPDLKLALLTGSLKAAEKREVLETMPRVRLINYRNPRSDTRWSGLCSSWFDYHR